MKKSLLGLALIGALVTAPAMAADMPLKAPPAPAPAPAFSWTGFYIGGQGGYGWGASSATEDDFFLCPTGGACAAPTPVVPPIGESSIHQSGGFGGATVGANYQFSNRLVVGIEGDWSAASIDGSNPCSTAFIVAAFGGTSGVCTNNLQDFATVTGRFGWAWDRALFYLKGGGAWARYNESITSTVLGIPGPAANLSENRSGWTVGVGVEYALTQNWSFKVEYDHMDFGTANVTYPFVNVPPFVLGIFNAVSSETERFDIIRAGVNYRFNWWGGPIATRY